MEQASSGGRGPHLGDVNFPTGGYSHSFLTPTLFFYPVSLVKKWKQFKIAQLRESRFLNEDLQC